VSQEKLSRRDFVSGAIGLGLGVSVGLAGSGLWSAMGQEKPLSPAVLVPPRRRLSNPYVEDGKPVVVIIHGRDFPAMLAKGLTLLGGLRALGPDRSVIVKPNFVFDKVSRYPTTTDENSVLAMIRLLQLEGFRDLTVADRRGRKVNGRAGGKFEWSGLNDRAAAGGFKTDSLLDDEVAEAVAVRDAGWSELQSYGVIRKIYDAGLIVNMPTVKRHTHTNLTAALKNMMGVLDVPTTETMHLWGDANKAAHDALSQEALNRRLARAVAEAAAAVNAELTVIDARTVLCRNHLSYEQGDPREADRLIISGDPVAADVAAARLLKEVDAAYDPGPTRETFAHAAQLSLGIADPDGVVVRESSL